MRRIESSQHYSDLKVIQAEQYSKSKEKKLNNLQNITRRLAQQRVKHYMNLIQNGYQQNKVSIFKEDVNPAYEPPCNPIQQLRQEIPSEILNAKAQSQIQKILKQDTRQKVKNCLQYPYSAIGLLKFSLDKANFFATAFLIGPNIVMTAAHNVYSHQKKKQYQSFIFCPGFKQNTGKTYKVKKVYYLDQYKRASHQRKKQIDYALLQLEENAGQKYGYFGIDFGYVEFGEVKIYGYPNYIYPKRPKGTFILAKKSMYGASGKCFEKNNTQLSYQIQTSQGQSGSPVFIVKNGKPYVIGIHTQPYDQQSLYSSGLLLNQDIKLKINEWFGVIWKELELPRAQILSDFFQIISKELSDLQKINFNCCPNIGDRVIFYIAQTQWTNLKSIDIGINKITINGIDCLIQVQLPNLTSINLEENWFEDKGLQLITKANWPKLTDINLNSNRIEANGANLISKALWPNLTNLNLCNNEIGNDGVKFLAKALWPNLASINLSSNNIGVDGAYQISKASWSNLTDINLQNNYIGDKGVSQIRKAQWLRLKSICLSNNQIGSDGVNEISKALWPNLTTIILDHNCFGDEGASQITEAKWPKLINISLACNKITDKGGRNIIKASWPNLKSINLAGNNIVQKSASYLYDRWQFANLQ